METAVEDLEELQCDSQASFDSNTKKLIKIRGLGNSSKEISTAIFSHMVYHSLNFLGLLYSTKLTSLAEVISILEVGVRTLPKECYFQLHQIIACCLDPVYSFMLAKQIQATELLYSELCSIATMFSFSANHLETWSDETKHCYHSIFVMFAAVWKDTIYNVTRLDLNIFDKDKLEKLLAASKKKLTLLFKDTSLTLDLGVENLLSIALSGMVALLSNSEIDYDVNFPLLLAIIFYSLHKNSPVSLQAHVWKIMPKALAGTFLSYLKPESILLLIDITCQEESICDEVKNTFALNLGKLICSISANCTSADINHLPFPSGEVLCAYCDKEYMVVHQGELCSNRKNKLVSLLLEPLEDYPMQALRFLLNFILGTDCLQTRVGASLSLCRMLTHLPLKCYTPLLKLIPELVLLIMDDNSKVRLIISTALLNISPFEDSEERQIFLLKLVDHMFNSIKDDPSEFSLNLALSLVGNLAKKAYPVALSFMLNCLSQYLYHDDKQITASIFSQLHGIAAAHKVTLKTLFSPLWETLAGFILTDFKSQGHFVTNMAVALQVDQSGLLKLACPYLLPMVVIKRDFEMLKKLAEVIKSDIGRSRSEETQVLDLCSDYLPYILAGLFLWDDEEYVVSLNFFFGLFNPNTPLKGKVIIDSCIADLILVLSFEFGRLGDHEISNAKLETSFAAIAKNVSEDWASEHDLEPLQYFLVFYFMYIISSYNSLLAEYHFPQDYTMQITALLALDVIIKTVGCHINTYIPQILSAVKSSTHFPFLTYAGVRICKTLIETMGYSTCKPYVNQILAMFSECYPTLKKENQGSVLALFKLIYQKSIECKNFTVISLPDLNPEFESLNLEMQKKIPKQDPAVKANQYIQTLASDNFDVCVLALKDLYSFLLVNKDIVATWVFNEPISPIVGNMILSLSYSCEKFNEMESTVLQYHAMLCFGILGAVDPDRLPPKRLDCQTKTSANLFTKEACIKLGSDLIEHYLVHLYSSTMVVKDQFVIAYTIQELMRFCDFNHSNISSDFANEVKPFSREVWDKLPNTVVETIRPLMLTDYRISRPLIVETEHPIFSSDLSFESWVCRWTSYLILQVKGDITKGLFKPCFKAASRHVDVATFLLPNLILALVLQNNTTLTQTILQEIHAVLNVSANQPSNILLGKASQLIFSIIVHLSNWCSLIREHMYSNKLARNLQIRDYDSFNALFKICQGFVQGIPNLLLAQAAHKTQNYFHAVFYLEAHIREVNARKELTTEKEHNDLYTQLHDLYFQLDDIDGLQGVQSLFLVGNVQQQLREHEASKNWPAAQSCYEVLANAGLNSRACQQGIISCMKNMGSLDLATNYLAGLTAKLPGMNLIDDLQQALDESSWRLGNWDLTIDKPTSAKPSFDQSISNLLLSSKHNNSKLFFLHLEDSRKQLLTEFSSNISHSYVRGYNTIVWAHMLDEAETLYKEWNLFQEIPDRLATLNKTEATWNNRLLSTNPSFKIRENILNFQRVILDTLYKDENQLDRSLVSRIKEMRSHNYIQCAKLARKTGYFQTSYRSLMEHLEHDKLAVAKELAKWHWSQGQFWPAMEILMKLLGETAPALIAGNYDSHAPPFSESMDQSQVRLKLVKWMMSTNACNQDVFAQEFRKLREAQPEWGKCHFYATQHLFGLLAQEASDVVSSKKALEVTELVKEMVICGHNCLKFSSKYVYQLLPRILTQWLHCNIAFKRHVGLLDKANACMLSMANELPTYMFLPVFSQVVSRLNTDGPDVLKVLNIIIFRIIMEYPQQALWALVGTSASQEKTRSARYTTLLNKAKSSSSIIIIAEEIKSFCQTLRSIANFSIKEKLTIEEEERKVGNFLCQFTESKPLSIIMPTQAALSFSLPSTSSSEDLSKFTPFPSSLVTIKCILPSVKVMSSLMRPRLLQFMGSDNIPYHFLCKPKDDLRKDSRLIELFHFLNRMFRQDPEARRRHLNIQTFAVVPLDHQCGLVEWVNNLEVLRGCIQSSYSTHGVKGLSNDQLTSLMNPQIIRTREQRIHIFEKEILPAYPPMLYKWFLKIFPHPVKWFAARATFAHSLAVMSMVGFVVGLGDRHGENILLDKGTGSVVHVDFSSLFEVSIDLKVPELVPFRLTSNMIHALGVTGYEGTFRKSCEVTMKILRANRETLKALLETFLHDPLADFLNKKKIKMPDNPLLAGRTHFFKNILLYLPYKNLDVNSPVNNPDALWALDRISKKLDGKSSSFFPAPPGTDLQPISVEGQVLQLLQSATDSENLFQMYLGWGPFL
ncbi:hypothetical protein DSO57_1018908 [Entomophthora muscae]|uniref:Uncharacterized protein n=1 Tax=Entomophthora muscae TaxID=34485 RepID=A0ACC2TS74_9FUNG|nr:hypothetical protein DSO57_1018908 [Entomophthora muscae]